MEVTGKKIYVGLSGGVDSAVSAALLKDAGAEVTGVFIKGWYPPGMPCTWADDRRDAMRVAARLSIPFVTLDASAEYKKSVIDYLIAEYQAGRTPNPDVMCNKEVKFGAFYRFAMASGADAIATGHYRSGEKDQSYFLWAVPKEIFANTIFPVGAMDKRNVRRLAKRFRLPNAEKRDSQGVCFLGSVSIEDFLRSEFGTHEGKAFDEQGTYIGLHDGVLLHTIGERISLAGAQEGPWFVLAKDLAQNTFTVGHRRRSEKSLPESIRFTSPNWQGEPETVREAQYRYRGPRVKGHIKHDRFVAEAPLPELIAPGQSVVFYRGSELIGGGIIAA